MATRSDTEAKLGRLLDDYDRRPDTSRVAFALARPSIGWSWTYGDPESRYFIASITKLYTAALVMQLVDDGRIELDAPIGRYLPRDVVGGLNVIGGVDHGDRISVRHLLAHTSGIADYFEQRRDDGSTTFARALADDIGWSFADVLDIAKHRMRSHFVPGAPGRAFYSDTNYQLLGAIIEVVTGSTYEHALRAGILDPLDLTRTSLFTDRDIETYDTIAPMLIGQRPIRIPRAMASVGADGGIVSTTADGIRFLRAFFGGELFAAAHLAEMQGQWRRIFFPLRYGVGVMRFTLPRVMTGFRAVPAVVGHSGASGAVAFHVPASDLYLVGTVNQAGKRSLVYQLMTRIVMLVQKGMP